MSILNPKIENPVKKYIEYSGDTGNFFYYDKEAKMKIAIPYPFYFIAIDRYTTIKGFSEKYGSGLYSNEIKQINSETLKVKSFKGGYVKEGLYADIKDEVKAIGGKFTKSVYAVWIKGANDFELVNLQIKGAAFSPFFEFEKNVNLDTTACKVLANSDHKKGKTEYKAPIYEPLKLNRTGEAWNFAKESYVLLSNFFKQRKNDVDIEIVSEIPVEFMENEEDELIF